MSNPEFPAEFKADESTYRDQLKNAIQCSTNQERSVWTIFGVFWATQGVLLIRILETKSIEAEFLITIAAVATSWVWRFLQVRAMLHLDRYDYITGQIEQLLRIKPKYSLTHNNKTAFEKFGLNSHQARPVMKACLLAVAILWSIWLVFITEFWFHDLSKWVIDGH